MIKKIYIWTLTKYYEVLIDSYTEEYLDLKTLEDKLFYETIFSLKSRIIYDRVIDRRAYTQEKRVEYIVKLMKLEAKRPEKDTSRVKEK